MDDSPVLLILIIAAALGFGFTNGLNDAANAIATAIGSRVISPRNAIILASVCNFAGTLSGALIGAHVAKTIGKGIVSDVVLTNSGLGLLTVFASVTAAIIWVSFATRRGIPLSVSHSLVAGMLGAGIATVGVDNIVWGTMTKVLLAVLIAPTLGFTVSYIFMVIVMWMARGFSLYQINSVFSTLQIFAAGFVAYAHGKNDGQMPIGIIMLSLAIYNHAKNGAAIPELSDYEPHIWIVLFSAVSVILGITFGGWRVIKTVGTKITPLTPVQGSVAETASGIVIEAASAYGIPVSTTQIISGSVMGVGATKRISAVRWGVARTMVIAWLVTFPVCICLGYILSKILAFIG